jgi:hypothetical protein
MHADKQSRRHVAAVPELTAFMSGVIECLIS